MRKWVTIATQTTDSQSLATRGRLRPKLQIFEQSVTREKIKNNIDLFTLTASFLHHWNEMFDLIRAKVTLNTLTSLHIITQSEADFLLTVICAIYLTKFF